MVGTTDLSFKIVYVSSKYPVNPLYPAAGAVTFFRVSKLTHRGPERQCNLARDRNPAKGKPLQGRVVRMATVHRRGYFFERFNGSPVVFPAFAVGETASPERSVRRMQRGQDIPHVKGLKKTRG